MNSMILPNDPLVGSQWYLSNTGQRGEQGYDLNLLPIWGRYNGQGLIVAVNDDGMDLTHPDLVANLLVNLAYDGISDLLGQGFIDHSSLNSHGTVVGSIIGMVANNGVGGTGIACVPKSSLRSWAMETVRRLRYFYPTSRPMLRYR